MESLTVVFGRRLRMLRKAKGLTQEELGRAAGIDYKHIGGIERGEHAPSFDAIEKFVKALGVEYHELFQPERSVSGQVEENLLAIMDDIERLDRAQLKRFFADLLTSIRRMRYK